MVTPQSCVLFPSLVCRYFQRRGKEPDERCPALRWGRHVHALNRTRVRSNLLQLIQKKVIYVQRELCSAARSVKTNTSDLSPSSFSESSLPLSFSPLLSSSLPLSCTPGWFLSSFSFPPPSFHLWRPLAKAGRGGGPGGREGGREVLHKSRLQSASSGRNELQREEICRLSPQHEGAALLKWFQWL